MDAVILMMASAMVGQTADADALAAIAIAKAIAASETPTVNSIIRKMTYQEASNKAIKEDKPMVVFVGKDARNVPDMVTIGVNSLNGYPSPSVVVGVPKNGQLLWKATLKTDASDESICAATHPKAVSQPADPFDVSNRRSTTPVRPDDRGAKAAGPQFNASHNCPSCGTRQTIISGKGPGGTHTHTCSRCGTTWYH